MGKFRTFMARFMYGRYGVDRLYTGFFVLFLIIQIFNVFINNIWLSMILSLLSTLTVVIMFYRVFSKNIYKRRNEEMIYLKFLNKIKKPFSTMKRRFSERKTYKYKKCPSCKAQLRFPKKKGTMFITCPKCKASFKIQFK